MRNTVLRIFVIAVGLAFLPRLAQAQVNVFALSGTVTSVNNKIKMLELNTDDGSSGHFQWTKDSDTDVDFDKAAREDSVPPNKFTKTGDHAIVYYYGDEPVRTVVAVHDLGAAPVEKTAGEVVKLDRHEHLLTIKNAAGSEVTFHLNAKTVADTMTGVAEGWHFDLDKGDAITVISRKVNGNDTVLLITPTL